MFDSLSDRIRQDEQASVSTAQRLFRWLLVAILSVLVFGGLYLGVSMLEGG